MNPILLAALMVGVTGLVLGLLLGVADKFLTVEQDPRVAHVISMLPGYNCGACGKPGCAGLAEALVEGAEKVDACKPCKADVKKQIENFLKQGA